MHLLNGTSTPRQRNSEGCAVLACGCAHDDVRWLQLCDAHYADWHDRHEAAHIAHRATLKEHTP